MTAAGNAASVGLVVPSPDSPEPTLPEPESLPAVPTDTPPEPGDGGDEGELGGVSPSPAPNPNRIAELVEAEAARVEAEEAAEAKDEPTPVEQLTALCEEWVGAGLISVDELLTMFKALVEEVQPFPQSSVMVACEECHGWGSVKTGAVLPGPDVQPCPGCNGNGYVDRRSEAAFMPAPPPPAGPAGPQPPGSYHDPLTIPPEEGGEGAPGMMWDATARRWAYPPTPA